MTRRALHRKPYAIAVAASAGALVVLTLGQLPRNHPIIAGLRVELASSVPPRFAPAFSPTQSTVHITGTTTVQLHAVLTVRGTVPSGDEGPVRIFGSVDGGRWQTLAVVDGSSGGYVARIPADQRGNLRIHILFQDGARAAETIRVD